MILAEENQKVIYRGNNRPHLNGLVGEVIQTKLGGSSVLVRFSGKGVVTYDEWVGVYYLDPYTEEEKTYSIVSLQERLTELDEEYKNLEIQQSELKVKSIEVDRKRADLYIAIQALKALGSS